jgi:hypothetical protein
MSNNQNNKKTLSDVELSKPESWIGIFLLVVGLLIMFVMLITDYKSNKLLIAGLTSAIFGAVMILQYFFDIF